MSCSLVRANDNTEAAAKPRRFANNGRAANTSPITNTPKSCDRSIRSTSELPDRYELLLRGSYCSGSYPIGRDREFGLPGQRAASCSVSAIHPASTRTNFSRSAFASGRSGGGTGIDSFVSLQPGSWCT